MNKQYKIIKNKKYNEYGKLTKVYCHIKELTLSFWFIKIWKDVDDNEPIFAQTIFFDSIKEAEIFIENILLNDKPRNVTVKSTAKTIKK